ncbi:MAG: efflux RND transporter permease subunit [Candidatus Omnitrophica bacterium]|nr:efflux RND transporter permease subunit [Candidatus Omnitrophota bacterium]
MNFSETFIKKPIMTMLVTVVVLLFGIAAYFMLPVSDLPVIDSPVITVNVAYPGASPNTMASTVASPLENQFSQIPGLTNMISDNTEGQTKILLTFELNRSVDLAAPDVQAAIQDASSDLPTDLPAPPTYSKTNPSDMPIMYLVVTSDTLTKAQLYDYGNKTIGQRISMVEGVSQVQVWAAKGAVRVQVDPNKLAAFKIGINDIANAINTGTVTIPGGSLNGPIRTFSIEPQGQLFKAKDYDELIVAYRNNAPVRLKNLGQCVDSVDNDVVNAMFGLAKDKKMRPGAVVLAISRAAGTNTVGLAAKIRELIDVLRTEIPGSVKLEIMYDRSVPILDSIEDVKETIIIALILVVLVIFLFLGRVSDTIIPSVTLPLSIIATFIIMYMAKFSLDNLSLMALTLSIGFVVDDAIVVLENTVRLIEKGQKPFQAAINSAREISFTVMSMTLSLSVIFVPLVFMAGVVGRTFREFAITVIMAIMMSGVISLTLTPMMCARMLKETSSKKTLVQRFVDSYLGAVIRGYGALLKWTLKNKFITIVGWIVCFAGTMWFFNILPQTFLPEGDSGAIMGQIVMPMGTSTNKIQDFQDRLNNIMINDPNTANLISVTGLNPGADQTTGIFFDALKPLKERKPMPVVIQEIRKKLAGLTGGFAFSMPIPALKISTGGESTATGSKYSYVIKGADQAAVYTAVDKIYKKVRSMPGFLDVQTNIKLNMPQLNLTIDRDHASSLGITAGDIEYALSLAYAQGRVTLYKTDIDQYNVIVELTKQYQLHPEQLSTIYLRSSVTNNLVPLASIAKWEEVVGPQDVPHFNQLNAGTISFNIPPGMPLGDATNALYTAAQAILPPGVTGTFQGEAAEFQEAIASLGILMLIAIFIKYVILGILYESYVHPITIITTLPVATFGGLLTLYMFGSQLSLYAYIGLFMLLGIVAKNGIMMVDFANENIAKKGMNDFDAIHEASVVRFRPILMTGIAAIMGALPIAMGYGADGASRQPLGLVVVGGLIFSQVVTLFITPGLFLYMQTFQRKFLDKFELTRESSVRKDEES